MDGLDTIPREDTVPVDTGVLPLIGLRPNMVEAALGRVDSALSARFDRFISEGDWPAALVQWFGGGAARYSSDQIVSTLARDIAAIDALIGDQIDAVLHHTRVKRLEACWRGIEYLLDEAEGDEKVRIRVFNATWPELCRDFDRAIEFDQSTLFAKIYSEEYGMPGGVPYGLVLCDYAVRHRAPSGAAQPTDDVSALAGLAQVAAAAFSPTVISAAPELFGVSTFADLSYAQHLDAGFRLVEYQRWRNLREQEESRFLGVVLPRVLLRDRYRDSPARTDGFRYREGGNDLNSWLWGNAVFALGAVAIRSFRQSGWFGEIRGLRVNREEAGLVSGLTAPAFSTGEAVAYRRPLEVELTDNKQKALEELGFISVSPCNFTKSIVFLGIQSLHAVPNVGVAAARANARLSAMFQYVMCVSRFAHYVKVMARDRVGGFTTAAELERYLGDWLRNYTIGNADAGPELKARYPLSHASLEVRELPGRPGVMNCVMHLQPHFQFDQMISGLRLRTELESSGGR